MGSRLKLLTIFGTRPEAIKLFPLIRCLESDERFVSRVCVTGQHRELLGQVLDIAGIVPDHSLAAMRPGQSLDCLTGRLLELVGPVLDAESPDIVVVQGDTSSAFAAALAAHYRGIPIAHVEAGLRSGNLDHPRPEEFNRKAIAALASFHFAPTRAAMESLLRENVAADTIHLTGNTGIDAVLWMATRLRNNPRLAPEMARIEAACAGRRIISVTCHRRENLAHGIAQVGDALDTIARRDDVAIVLPAHPNPLVAEPLMERLSGRSNIHVTTPFCYPDFVRLLQVSHLVLTDSGGVQEEAATLGTPLLVLRDTTERPEGVASGMARLVGTDPRRIVAETMRLLDECSACAGTARAQSLYGDGRASGRIAGVLGEMSAL